MNFQDLKLAPAILKALEKEHYTQPTPIQEQSIPAVLAGKDLLGCAQTGTGKTAAFALPIIHRLSAQPAKPRAPRRIRSLIVTPTRELAIQIMENVQAYAQFTDLRCVVIVGGVSQRAQEIELARGTDLLVATPGRLLDLMHQQHVDLQHVQMFVLDEADRMLDMGFIHDVKKIIAKLPPKKQTLLFSATMPPEIAKLVDSLLVEPVYVEITPVSSTAERIEQALYFVDKDNKQNLLTHLLHHQAIASALVFTRTKHGADRVARGLNKANIAALAIHGNKSQNARQTALNNFKSGVTRVLVATDIAARGIDIDELPYVINFNLPNIPETYVHRIGRTGRAGMSGTAISFCEAEELPYLKDIEKLIKKAVPRVEDHPYPMLLAVPPQAVAAPEPARAKGGKPGAGGARGAGQGGRGAGGQGASRAAAPRAERGANAGAAAGRGAEGRGGASGQGDGAQGRGGAAAGRGAAGRGGASEQGGGAQGRGGAATGRGAEGRGGASEQGGGAQGRGGAATGRVEAGRGGASEQGGGAQGRGGAATGRGAEGRAQAASAGSPAQRPTAGAQPPGDEQPPKRKRRRRRRPQSPANV